MFIAASFTIAKIQCSQIYEKLHCIHTTEYNPLVKRNASQRTEKYPGSRRLHHELSKRSLTLRMHAINLYLYTIFKPAKLISVDANKIVGCL